MPRPDDYDYGWRRRKAEPEMSTNTDMNLSKPQIDPTLTSPSVLNSVRGISNPSSVGYNPEYDSNQNLDRKLLNGARGAFVSDAPNKPSSRSIAIGLSPNKNALSRVRKR